jgi:hypothetical protein
MKISHSETASDQKRTFIQEFPGLKRHFIDIEQEIQTNPENGTKETMMSKAGRGIQVRTMSAETEIFSGVISYSKELIAVYICTEDFSMGRIIQYLF